MPVNNRRRNPFLLAPALAFLVLIASGIIGFFDIGAMSGVWSYITALLLYLIVFGVPSAIFLICRGTDMLRRMGTVRPSGKEIGLTAVGTVVLLLQTGILTLGPFHTAYDGNLYELFGSSFSGAISSTGELILALFSLVLLPAVCEEFFFRGIILCEYRLSGVAGKMLMSSILFALFSLGFSKFIVFFLNGLLLSVIVFLTDNVICAIASHGVCNLFLLFGGKFLKAMSSCVGGEVVFWFLLITLYLSGLFFFFLFAEKILRRRAAEDAPQPVLVPKKKRPAVIYDVLSAPPFLADVLAFFIFAVIGIFL